MSRFLDARYEALRPYVPGEQPQDQQYIKLNTNESPYPPAPAVQRAVAQQAGSLQLYPDPTCRQLVEPLAASFGLPAANVMVGNGSDEILAFLFQALCPVGAAFADLTYGFYAVFAKLYGVKTKIIPLRQNLTIEPENYYGVNRSVFIANPNAPTGLALPPEAIAGIASANPGNLVVVDEAYVDFGATSVLPLLAQHDNLVVVGTFSKSRSLAGGRLGYAAAGEAIIQDLNRIRYSFNPYNVNRLTLAAGAAAVESQEYYEQCQQNIIDERANTMINLRKLGFEGTESLANFVFVRHPRFAARQLYEKLRAGGILVRWFDADRARDYLRITIGTPAQMDALHAALQDILRASAPG